jgi:SAM-dependent methyltransferase
MSKVFGNDYSDLYDVFYHDKEYDKECDLIESVFRKYKSRDINTILDLGCGTGGHALSLAKRGYRVAGVDRSERMLARAKDKVGESQLDGEITWRQADVRNFNLGRQFDAALMMFAVLGYQLTNEDVRSALSAVRRHLSKGDLFIFDVWYGPAVLSEKPEQRMRAMNVENGRVVRFASSQLDTGKHVCHVHYELWRFEGDRLVSETEETHTMRYYFPLELQQFLENAGFQIMDLKRFPEFDQDPDEKTWNVVCVAKAV